MYQVIARKYRPQTFEDVVNQDHVKQTLSNALTQGRVGHGYIFSGPRGTGKTTMARIVAKALNCEKGPTPQPCLECASCKEIAGGNSMDLVEIDAASNRRIDDIRELRENVRYRPVRDAYKVFIIDEAHQITADAFNALLKTLEEPPEWVVFILCTTEPHQFPSTIVSRCQNFPFRTVEMDLIVGRLRYICEQEEVAADEEALVTIAIAGDGSIRDSLSTLDQAIASFGKKLEAGPVKDLLGVIPAEIIDSVTSALLESQPRQMLEVVDELCREGRHLQHFSGELARYFRNLLVMKVSGADTRLVTAGDEERRRISRYLEQFSQEDLTRYLQLSIDLYRDLQHATQPRFRLEIGLLKLVHAGRLTPIENVLARWGDSGLGGGAGGATASGGSSGPKLGAAPGQAAGAAGERYESPPGSSVSVPASPSDLQREGPSVAREGPSLESAATLERRSDSIPPALVDSVPAAVDSTPPTMMDSAPAAAMDSTVPLAREHADEMSPKVAPSAVPEAGETVRGVSDAAAVPADAKSGLQQKVVDAFRTDGDEFTADAIEHALMNESDGQVEIRPSPDDMAALQINFAVVTRTIQRVAGQKVHVKLGGQLGSGDAEQIAGDATERAHSGANGAVDGPSSSRSRAGDSGRQAGPEEYTDNEKRALEDPEVQEFQQQFGGRIREVRDLRGYSQ